MIFIFGGAYQGKLEYALQKYNTLSVFQCGEDNPHIDFNKDIINSFHLFTLALLKIEIDPVDYIKKNMTLLNDKIIICNEIGSGIVPTDNLSRRWVEATGRCATLLACNAHEVIRVFCGLGMKQ